MRRNHYDKQSECDAEWGGTDTVTIEYGIGVNFPKTTFVNSSGELITTRDHTVQVPKNTIVRVFGEADWKFSASGEYTFVCGNELADFAMYIYGDVVITG